MSSLCHGPRALLNGVSNRHSSRRSTAVRAYAPAGASRTGRSRPVAAPATLIGLNAGPAPPQRFSPDSILPLLSSAVESSAQVARFEALAGRSAMIGFLIALLFETGEQSVFSIAPDQLALVAGAFAASIGAAAALAAAPPAPAAAVADFSTSAARGASWWGVGARVHEAVVSSLTATQRSASGVTQLKVDEVVDFVLDRCLTQSVHPVFGPLRDAGSTVATVMDSLLTEDRGELPH